MVPRQSRDTTLQKTRSVLSRPRYLFLAAGTAAVAYSLYALLLNYTLLFQTAAAGDIALLARLVPSLIAGFPATTTAVSLVITTVISAAIGLNVALLVFRLVEQASFGREGAGTLGGMMVAVVAPACPACATALFAVAGVSSLFAILPFNGTEVKILALFMLIGSAYWITTQINEEVCEFC